jgi:hypothetical protein
MTACLVAVSMFFLAGAPTTATQASATASQVKLQQQLTGATATSSLRSWASRGTPSNTPGTSSLSIAAGPEIFACEIPFLNQGASAYVAGSLVTAVTNSANPNGPRSRYLHQSRPYTDTSFTFYPPIAALRVTTLAHDDAKSETTFERYVLDGRDATGSAVFSEDIQDVDGTFAFISGSNAGEVNGPVTTLNVKYEFDTQTVDFQRGSFITFVLDCAPDRQEATGVIDTEMTYQVALKPTTFEGDVTYTITSGTLPEGLTLNTATGTISGTPTGSATTPTEVGITATGATFGTAITEVAFTITTAQSQTTQPEPPAITAPTTTVPVTTVPQPTVPTPVPAGDGSLPRLDPGVSEVLENGQPVNVSVEVRQDTNLVLVGENFELDLAGDCSDGSCRIGTTEDGRHVLTLETGGTAVVSGFGFLPGSLVHVWLFSEPRYLGATTVAADGTFRDTFGLDGVALGEHTLQVNGTSFDGQSRTTNLGVRILASPQPEITLPTSGGNVPTAWIILFLAAGAMLILTGRRRHTV